MKQSRLSRPAALRQSRASGSVVEAWVAFERAIIAASPRPPELAEPVYAQGARRGLDGLARDLADQTARGVVQIDEPDRAAEAFVGLIEGEVVRRAIVLGAAVAADARRDRIDYAVSCFLRAHATTWST